MQHQSARCFILVLLTIALSCPASAQMFGVVHDPQNEVVLLEQKVNQATQIQQQLTQINNQLRNLRNYGYDWSSIQNNLLQLRRTLSSPTAKVDNATLQIQQMDGELATLGQIQSRNNAALGQLQASQTQSALLAQLAGQLQKQRQLTLATIMQEQLELQQFKALGYGQSSAKSSL